MTFKGSMWRNLSFHSLAPAEASGYLTSASRAKPGRKDAIHLQLVLD